MQVRRLPLRAKHTNIAHRVRGPTGWLFLFAVLMAAGLLFTMVFFVRYNISFCALLVSLTMIIVLVPASATRPLLHAQIIMFSDLECDYINPIDLCNKLNQVCTGFLLVLSRAIYIRCLVCASRAHSTRFRDDSLPNIGTMDSFPSKRAVVGLQHQQVRPRTLILSAGALKLTY